MSKQLLFISYAAPVIQPLQVFVSQHSQKIALITTALEKEEQTPDWFSKDKQALASLQGVSVTEYTITGKTPRQLTQDLQDFDTLYVAGGNTMFLLEQIQKSDFNEYAQKHVNSGKAYIGQSAGAMVAGPTLVPAVRSDHAAHAKIPDNLEGMGLVDFTVLPHWGSDELREVYFSERLLKAYDESYKLMPLSNVQYIVVKDDWYRLYS